VTRYLLDSNIISGSRRSERCIVVTDNERNFAGLKMINPLRVAT
jgi:hypothetical protein